MHHQRARAPGDRRRDRRVLQLDSRVVDGGTVGGEGCLERVGRAGCRLDLLAGRDTTFGELGRALRLRGRVSGLRGVACQVGLGLRERRLKRARIEREEHLPSLTSWPSWKLTELSSPVTWARIDTVDEASTLPMTSMASGIGFCSECPTVPERLPRRRLRGLRRRPQLARSPHRWCCTQQE